MMVVVPEDQMTNAMVLRITVVTYKSFGLADGPLAGDPPTEPSQHVGTHDVRYFWPMRSGNHVDMNGAHLSSLVSQLTLVPCIKQALSIHIRVPDAHDWWLQSPNTGFDGGERTLQRRRTPSGLRYLPAQFPLLTPPLLTPYRGE
ncbi:hypothetical protein G7Y89_g4087 [Cudoniella acicularis]|uniref:Uncharacterized protein n=1 Tax=Cudoniella acicularis TaxID=354080 RepID=A0A8H4RRI5_9HELO|nr:hypothetical protein G7Y89_g4087 [Cudoniella acicularis]